MPSSIAAMELRAARPGRVNVHLGGAVRSPVERPGGSVHTASVLVAVAATTAFLVSAVGGASPGHVVVLGLIALSFLLLSVDLETP